MPLLLAPLALLGPSPSYADTWSAPDPAGDAIATTYDAEAEPCPTYVDTPSAEGDIQRLSVGHRAERVLVRMRVAGLTELWRTSADIDIVTPDRGYAISLYGRKGRTHSFFGYQPDWSWVPDDDADDGGCGQGYLSGSAGRDCRGLTVRIDVVAGTVRVAIPRSCIGSPRWVRVGGSVGIQHTRSTWSSDQWVPAKDDGDWRTPAVGRRVPADRGRQ